MRRWTLRVLCWLALGAVVNVGVTCASVGSNRPGFGVVRPLESWPLQEYLSKNWPPPYGQLEAQSWGWTVQMPVSDRAEAWMNVDTFGWPMRCARRVSTFCGGSTVTHREGWQLVESLAQFQWLTGKWANLRFFPTHVLAGGFILNTLLYAVLSAIVWYGPGTIRRWHRRRHQLCIHCAYPVADPAKPCSECGRSPAAR